MKSSTKNIAVAALVWLSLASRSIDAFTRPAALNIVAHRKEQVTSNLSASTSLFGLFKDHHHDTPPEDDGGPLPTKEEQDEITKVRRNVLLPHFRTPIISRIVSKVKSRVEEKNIVLFGILDFIRKGTALQGIVEINQGDIPFTDKTEVCMWFEVQKQNLATTAEIMIAYDVFLKAPALVVDEESLMNDDDYPALVGDLIDPHHDQMKVGSPIECFLRNAPAFCAPLPEDETVSVCDLDYLGKYQVKSGTNYRYGGIAQVKNGDIIEISGYNKKDHPEEFETRLNIFLSSFAVHLVVVRHAGMAHLALYQKYLMRLTTNRSEEYKDKWNNYKSGPKLLMKALTPERTNTVNWNIQLLIGPGNSLVGRATSFTNDGLTLLNKDKYKEFYAMSPDEIIKEIGSCGSKGWNSACQGAWMAAKKVVNTICKDLVLCRELKETDLDDLAMLVWTGTFYHGFIGDFQLDNSIKGNLPFLLTGKKHVQSEAYATLATTIGASTMTRTMDMDTLGKYFAAKEDRDAWAEYQRELTACAKETGIEGFTYEGAVYNAIDF